MRRHLVLALILLAAACRGSGSDRAGATTSTTRAEAPTASTCPLGVPDARVAVADEPDRVVVTFEARPEHVAELRGRVASQAAQAGPGRREGLGHEGVHGQAHGHGLRLWDMPEARAIVEETPDGARLHVMPLDPTDLEALREKLRARVRALADTADERCDRGRMARP